MKVIIFFGKKITCIEANDHVELHIQKSLMAIACDAEFVESLCYLNK